MAWKACAKPRPPPDFPLGIGIVLPLGFIAIAPTYIVGSERQRAAQLEFAIPNQASTRQNYRHRRQEQTQGILRSVGRTRQVAWKKNSECVVAGDQNSETNRFSAGDSRRY